MVGFDRLERNLIEASLQWFFLKVIGKRASKREIDEHFRRAWGCKTWIRIQQMSSCAFRLGLQDMTEYARLIKAKWDWFRDSIFTIKE